MKPLLAIACLLTLGLLLPGAFADSVPQLQPILRAGDRAGSDEVVINGPLIVGALNDSGQISLAADSVGAGRLLLQYSDGQLLPIVEPGKPGPVGIWPPSSWFFVPVSMNQQGSVAFSGLLASMPEGPNGGTFLWDFPSRKAAAVALPGMTVGDNRRLGWAGGPAAVINNRDEVALVANVKNAAGRDAYAVFLRRSDGQFLPVALPDQPLPDGKKIAWAAYPSLTDDGTVALLVRPQGEQLEYPYLWENGTLRAVPTDSAKPPPGRFILGYAAVWANNSNRSLLLSAHVYGLSTHYFALYRWADGVVTPVAVQGQEMPGGGRLLTVQEGGVSAANGQGEHAFIALLQDGATAAYRIDAEGRLSLLLKSGATTSLGLVTSVGYGRRASQGIALNTQGQAVLSVSVDRGPDWMVLLTPPPAPEAE